jgi:nitroreductase
MAEIDPPDRGRERQAGAHEHVPVPGPRPGHEARGPLPAAPLPAGLVETLVATAARAPSLHNTQPWRFRTGSHGLELIADPNRVLPALDPAGREMLVSCGAALFGLRLAVRQAGYLPVVGLLPDPDQPMVLARVQLGAAAPMTRNERRLLAAVPHRHTHRGAFEPGPVAASLLAGLQRDATAEGATLCYVEQPDHYQQLAALVAEADRQQEADPAVRGETGGWTRPRGEAARDGVPAHAIPAPRYQQPGRLAQRDFDLGHDLGLLDSGGETPSATAVLVTAADEPADWLRAGQALHRLLLHAASRWVFASLHSQPLELPSLRAEVRTRLALPGAPQMILQLGRARTAAATARRPPPEVLD